MAIFAGLNLKTPFKLTKKIFTFKGRLDLTFKELTGNGKVEFEKADLSSGRILFVKRPFFRDTSNFHLKAFEEKASHLARLT